MAALDGLHLKSTRSSPPDGARARAPRRVRKGLGGFRGWDAFSVLDCPVPRKTEGYVCSIQGVRRRLRMTGGWMVGVRACVSSLDRRQTVAALVGATGHGGVEPVSDRSAIEWTEATWNPTTGCDRVSDGCDNCYAMTLAKRLKAMGQVKYQNDGDPRTSGPGFGLTVHPDALSIPYGWRSPRTVFVNSMSDLSDWVTILESLFMQANRTDCALSCARQVSRTSLSGRRIGHCWSESVGGPK